VNGSDARRPFAWGPVLFAAGLMFLILIAFAGRYGYHRDELYFLACAKHLAWGFVDQPPVTPMIAWVSEAIAPGSLVLLRTWPALFTAATLVLTVLCARELGAGRLGQTAAAVAVAVSPGLYGAGHMLSTSTLDITLWVGLTFLVLRLLRTRDVRLWVPIGAVVGVGLLNKWTIGFLVAGLVVGFLVGADRRLLANTWFLGACVVAFVLWLPNLLWQGAHGWPQLELFANIQEGASGVGESFLWIPLQFIITGPLGTPLWIAGLLRVLRPGEGRPWRALGIAYVALAVPLAVAAGDKPYYVAALYLPLMGAGAVPFERWWARNADRVRRVAVPVALGALALALLPGVLPILPARMLVDVPLQELNYDLGEQIAWPTFVRQIEHAYAAIPTEERAATIVLTGSYGESGAIERFGRGIVPYSGHNNYWWWRTPPAGTTTVLAVGLFPEEYLREFFGQVELIGRLDNGLGVETEEQGAPIWLAMEPREPLPEMWPDLRHHG
jgi:4-amino-4-deoxy-L-arabinose transferase-like glycosyltransferase